MPGSVCVWDVTWTLGDTETAAGIVRFKALLKKECKKWAFQLEEGHQTHQLHLQARVSLKNACSSSGALTARWKVDSAWNFSITSNPNTRNFDYQLKEDTRVDGPWTDQDREEYVPRQFRGLLDRLMPFQQEIWDGYDRFEDRIVYSVIDPTGSKGKSTLASLCDLHGRGIDMPICNDGEKLMQAICDMCMGRRIRDPKMVFIDLPRSMNQAKLGGMYQAIEQIKKGKLYDFRHSYKEWWIDAPQVWVFSNTMPNTHYLSTDRWRFYTITDDKELKRLTLAEARALETHNVDESDPERD